MKLDGGGMGWEMNFMRAEISRQMENSRWWPRSSRVDGRVQETADPHVDRNEWDWERLEGHEVRELLEGQLMLGLWDFGFHSGNYWNLGRIRMPTYYPG